MKLRYFVWPVVVLGALSLMGACSSDSGTSTGSGATGGEGEGGSGVTTGATSSMGNSDAGGMTSSEGGAEASGGVSAGGVTSSSGGASAGAGGAEGLCAGLDLNCPDDNNPCTEDDCNPATGKCGIPRSGTSCDDGLYCNGADTCDAGECTVHPGSPCGGTCNEAGGYCECTTKDDCPPDDPGTFGDCNWANECSTTATQSRATTTYSCNNVGKCVGAAKIETMDCTRDTQGVACTDDGKRCDGAETCNAGKCTSSKINPCAGNAAGSTFCTDSGAECGPCSGTQVQGGYPGCAGGESCCYNLTDTPGAWACKTGTCPIKLPVVATIKQTLAATIKQLTAAAPLE